MPQITFTIVQHSYHFEIFDDMPMGICVYIKKQIIPRESTLITIWAPSLNKKYQQSMH